MGCTGENGEEIGGCPLLECFLKKIHFWAGLYLVCERENSGQFYLVRLRDRMNVGALFVVVQFVVWCEGSVDSDFIEHLLSSNGGGGHHRVLLDFNGTKLAPGKGFAETYAMDVLLNLLMASKNNFPTAFSSNVGAQCKSDSLLYMEQVVRQSFAPVANPWALRSEFLFFFFLLRLPHPITCCEVLNL